jgi:hypothetical protein
MGLGGLFQIRKFKKMENHTLQAFQRWDEVTEYESDETSVTLLNSKGEAVAEFNYHKFTKYDFDFFKSSH